MQSARHPYLDLLAPRIGAAFEWFTSRYEGIDAASFPATYAALGRRLGGSPLEPTADELKRLSAEGVLAPTGWPLSGVGRAALLVKVCQSLASDARVALVASQFKTGDNEERAALLRALPLLPAPESFVHVAIEACRSHVQGVFEAIACENPYPARHFPEHNFNQLVLKAFFTGVAVRRITGLAERRTAELMRMAHAYASERRAAGRSVPTDLNLVTGTPTPPLGSPGAKP